MLVFTACDSRGHEGLIQMDKSVLVLQCCTSRWILHFLNFVNINLNWFRCKVNSCRTGSSVTRSSNRLMFKVSRSCSLIKTQVKQCHSRYDRLPQISICINLLRRMLSCECFTHIMILFPWWKRFFVATTTSPNSYTFLTLNSLTSGDFSQSSTEQIRVKCFRTSRSILGQNREIQTLSMTQVYACLLGPFAVIFSPKWKTLRND